MSFKWLKDQKKLREGWRPRCEISAEIEARFDEENVEVPRLTEQGVFVQERSYYRPGVFCVDGRLDTLDTVGVDTSQSENSLHLQPSYIVVLTCQDRREATSHCPLSSPDCHSRCCEPWEVWHSQQRRCKYNKSKHARRTR